MAHGNGQGRYDNVDDWSESYDGQLRRQLGQSEKTLICPPETTIFITPEAQRRMEAYIRHTPGEISGFGEVAQRGNDFVVTSVRIFAQECTGTETKISSQMISAFLAELIRERKDPQVFRCWWHSHGDLPAFFSGTDDETINETFEEYGWMVSIVGNKAGHFEARLDLFTPIRLRVVHLPFKIDWSDPALDEEIAAEVAAKVTVPKRRIRRIKPSLEIAGADHAVLQDTDDRELVSDEYEIGQGIPLLAPSSNEGPRRGQLRPHLTGHNGDGRRFRHGGRGR